MPKGNKKQRHKAKREAKRVELRRRQSASPVKLLAQARGELECWTSGRFSDFGQMQIFAYKRAGSLSGVACFLIDRGVVGLKDAWTRMKVDREEFQGMVDASGANGILMRRAEAAEVQNWIAGAVRWTHENGMRLPKDWQRTVSLIGGVGAWQSADVSAFAKEFSGHPEDLRQRLIGESFESYIGRSDVAFLFSDAVPYKNQRTGHYEDETIFPFDDDLGDENIEDSDDSEFNEDDFDPAGIPDDLLESLSQRFASAAHQLAAETVVWLAPRHEQPSPQLFEAWRSQLIAMTVAKIALPTASDDEIIQAGTLFLGEVSARMDPGSIASYELASAQVRMHIDADPNSKQRQLLSIVQ